jgi:hypothetical protein
MLECINSTSKRAPLVGEEELFVKGGEEIE